MKNKLIQKYLDLDINTRTNLYKAEISFNSGADKLLSMLDNKNWIFQWNFKDKASSEYKFKSDTFIEDNSHNILFTSSGGQDTTSGIYINDKCSIIMSFNVYKNRSLGFNSFMYYSLADSRRDLEEFISENILEIKLEKKLDMQLLTQEPTGSYVLRSHPVKPITNLGLEDNYNDGFLEVHSKLYNGLLFKDRSLNILHGPPGTGKTTYIKYLCYRLAQEGKEIVYLSPSITHMLSSPQFINNLELFKNKVVIIEDAEAVLTKTHERSQAVSNILNITDGILADIYNIHFIFTFNADIRNIDDALLRKGRLTLKYEFKELSKDKTAKLAEKLGVKIPTKSTLAEIYNEAETGAEIKNQVKLGF